MTVLKKMNFTKGSQIKCEFCQNIVKRKSEFRQNIAEINVNSQKEKANLNEKSVRKLKF